MTNQLQLIQSHPGWRLDRLTRERGRVGVAAARAVLKESRARARSAALAEGEPLEIGHHEAQGEPLEIGHHEAA